MHQVGIHPTILKDPVHDHDRYTVRKKQQTIIHPLLCLFRLQRNPLLLSTIVGLLSLSSFTTYLPNILKNVTMTHPSLFKSKLATRPRYIVIIEIF